MTLRYHLTIVLPQTRIARVYHTAHAGRAGRHSVWGRNRRRSRRRSPHPVQCGLRDACATCDPGLRSSQGGCTPQRVANMGRAVGCVDEGERAHGMVPHRRWRSSAERAHGPAKSASCHDLEWGTVRSRQSFCVCRLMVLKRQRLNLTLQARLGVHQVSMNLWFLVRSRCTS